MRSCAGYECAGDVMELLVGVQKAFFEICCFFYVFVYSFFYLLALLHLYVGVAAFS